MAKRLDASDWRCYFFDRLNAIAVGTGMSDRVYQTDATGARGGIVCRNDNGTVCSYAVERLVLRATCEALCAPSLIPSLVE